VSKRPASSNVLMAVGGSLPVNSTGISSYLEKLIPAANDENTVSSSSGRSGGIYSSRAGLESNGEKY